MNTPQAIAFDEFGRPFIILREQEKKRRLTGLDAQKVAVKLVNSF
jgi:T-complex protein 1 subunit epsilon